MIDKNTASNLVKIALNFDLEGEFDKADEVTRVLECACNGDEDAIRTAQNWMNQPTDTSKDMSESQLHDIMAKAMAAHKSGKSGWAVLNSLIANLPIARQSTMKQLFMQQTGQYGTNPVAKPMKPVKPLEQYINPDQSKMQKNFNKAFPTPVSTPKTKPIVSKPMSTKPLEQYINPDQSKMLKNFNKALPFDPKAKSNVSNPIPTATTKPNPPQSAFEKWSINKLFPNP